MMNQQLKRKFREQSAGIEKKLKNKTALEKAVSDQLREKKL
jgi:hypothetical protein